MPFSNSSINAAINFDLVNSELDFTDSVAYLADFGIATADVTGYGVFTGPDGNPFHTGSFGSPDTWPGQANFTVNLPLDLNGAVQKGNYSLLYVVVVDGATDPGTYSRTFSIPFCDDTPTADVDETVSCMAASVQVQDNTVTTGWTVNSRTFALYNSHPPTNYTTSGTLITQNSTTTDIYNGTWTWTLLINLSRDYDTHTVESQVNTTGQFEVNCAELCEYRCKYKSLLNQYYATKKQSMVNDVTLATGLLLIIYISQGCGAPYAEFAAKLTDIFQFYGIQDDCSCSDDDPIQPISGPGATINIEGVGSVIATDNGGGNWEISLTDTAEDVIANATNTVVTSTAATGEIALLVTLTIDGSTTPPTYTYNIRIDGADIPDSSDYGSVLSSVTTLTWLGGPVVNTLNKTNYGDHFDNAFLVTPMFNGSSVQPAGWAGMTAVLRFEAFNSGSGTNNWKAQVDLVDKIIAGIPPDYPVPVVSDVHRDATATLDYFEVIFPTIGVGPFAWTWGNLNAVFSELQIQVTIES